MGEVGTESDMGFTSRGDVQGPNTTLTLPEGITEPSVATTSSPSNPADLATGLNDFEIKKPSDEVSKLGEEDVMLPSFTSQTMIHPNAGKRPVRPTHANQSQTDTANTTVATEARKPSSTLGPQSSFSPTSPTQTKGWKTRGTKSRVERTPSTSSRQITNSLFSWGSGKFSTQSRTPRPRPENTTMSNTATTDATRTSKKTKNLPTGTKSGKSARKYMQTRPIAGKKTSVSTKPEQESEQQEEIPVPEAVQEGSVHGDAEELKVTDTTTREDNTRVESDEEDAGPVTTKKHKKHRKPTRSRSEARDGNGNKTPRPLARSHRSRKDPTKSSGGLAEYCRFSNQR